MMMTLHIFLNMTHNNTHHDSSSQSPTR